jgi:hypothetical protein
MLVQNWGPAVVLQARARRAVQVRYTLNPLPETLKS